jgi:predicted Zn-dependent protease
MKKYIILFLLLFATACATSPTGRQQLMLVSPEEAITASQSAYTQTLTPLAKSGKLDPDPQVSARVRHITGKIIAQAIRFYPNTTDWHWDIRVIEDPETINAWCMAGGKMAVYTGLLNKIKPTDDELAQVIAHEISHAIAHHTAEKMSVALASQLGLTTVAIVSGGDNGSNATLAGAALAAGLAIQLPNSRKAEAEADRIGIELAARAGYDPRAAETLWQKMSEAGGSGMPEFLSTHPNPMNRTATLRQLAPAMMPYYLEAGERPVYQFKQTRTP